MKFRFNNKFFRWGFTAFLVIAGSILFYYLLFHGVNINDGFTKILEILTPVIVGLIVAYLLSPVLNFVEQRVLKKIFGIFKIKESLRSKTMMRCIGIIITIFLFYIIIHILVSMMLSEIVPSIKNIYDNFDTYVDNSKQWAYDLLDDNPTFRDRVWGLLDRYSVEIETFVNENILSRASDLIMTVSLSIINVFKIAWNFVIGLIISVYILISKEKFAGQAKKFIYALFKKDVANIIINDFKFTHRTFVGFIGGKVVDSVIIGMLCFIGTTLMGTPYAPLISVIIGFTNVIPFFGPFIGAIPCTFLVFVVDPTKPLNILYFVLFVLALQQFDGNILGPKILGNSTGLAGFWVIFAITFFGGIFGIGGMIVGVPIFAVIYAAMKSVINATLKKKELPTNSKYYVNACMISEDGIEEYIPDHIKKDRTEDDNLWYGQKFVSSKEEHDSLVNEYKKVHQVKENAKEVKKE